MLKSLKAPYQVAIIGGGVIGLAIGWQLAEAGCRVALFEKHRRGIRHAPDSASWAAAGMLAAGIELEPTETNLLRLTRASQLLWPDFIKRLERASGMTIDYRREGTLSIALNRDQQMALRRNYDFQRESGVSLDWLSGERVRELEPSLSPSVTAGVLSRGDHQVDNRQLLLALEAAFIAAGGDYFDNCTATIDWSDDSDDLAVAVMANAQARYLCDKIVIASGAIGCNEMGGLAKLAPPIRPLKGQMVMAQMLPHAPLIRHIVWSANAYLVPRSDGRLLIGATVEEAGFNATITVGGIYALIEAAWRTLPAIEYLPIIEQWCGFRPTSPDDAPIMGWLESSEATRLVQPDTKLDARIVFATGHHRNGILLTPITAKLLVPLLLNQPLDNQEAELLRLFSPTRFYS